MRRTGCLPWLALLLVRAIPYWSLVAIAALLEAAAAFLNWARRANATP
jgi:hypothetical protein